MWNVFNDLLNKLLIYSAKNGYPKLVIFFKKYADINYVTADEDTALLVAVMHGHYQIVNILLASGADIDHPNQFGNTPLMIAAECGDVEMFTMLLAQYNRASNVLNETLLLAAKYGYVAMVNTLLMTNNIDINYIDRYSFNALLWAAQNGHVAVVTMLLAHNININYVSDNGYNALLLAAGHGHLAIVKVLLANTNSNIDTINQFGGDTPLMYATKNGYLETLKFLLVSGANINHVNQFGITPLMTAVYNGHAAIIVELLVSGANIDYVNQFGATAFSFVAASGKPTIKKLIIEISQFRRKNLLNAKIINIKINNILIKEKIDEEYQATIIKVLSDYQSYLEQKFKNSYQQLIDFFKQKFINNLKFSESKEQQNYSLLHIAVLNNWQTLVTYLMRQWPLDINYQDSTGNSAWNYACLLLQTENALMIKKNDQLSNEDQIFLKKIIPLSPNWNFFEKEEINKIASANRNTIFQSYSLAMKVKSSVII